MIQRKVQVWIFDRRGRVLLLKLTKRRGGFWQPVTGKVEDGEPSLVAALREATEETGLQVRSRPQQVGFSYRFDGRWGEARERAYILRFDDRVEGASPVLSEEHSRFEWVRPAVALAKIKFESNRTGLRRALKVFRNLGLAVALILVGASAAVAAQKARVAAAEAQVFRLPSKQSEQIEQLAAGVPVSVNDQPFVDEQGLFWFKARLDSGQIGFVEANSLELTALGKESRSAGIAQKISFTDERHESEWGFQLKVGPVGGVSVFPSERGLLGGEAEFATNLLLGARGYLRRMLAGAACVTWFPWQVSRMIVAAGPVFRFFGEGLSEPEFKLRAGYELTQRQFVFAPSFAYSLQLGKNPRAHFILFWDLGLWLGPATSPGSQLFVAPYLTSGLGARF